MLISRAWSRTVSDPCWTCAALISHSLSGLTEDDETTATSGTDEVFPHPKNASSVPVTSRQDSRFLCDLCAQYYIYMLRELLLSNTNVSQFISSTNGQIN